MLALWQVSSYTCLLHSLALLHFSELFFLPLYTPFLSLCFHSPHIHFSLHFLHDLQFPESVASTFYSDSGPADTVLIPVVFCHGWLFAKFLVLQKFLSKILTAVELYRKAS